MRILLLTQIFPYPPDAEPKAKTCQVLRHLAERGNSVLLASYTRPGDDQHVEAVSQFCEAVNRVPTGRSPLADTAYYLRSRLTRQPFLVERALRTAMSRLVQRLLAENSVDAVHADQFAMAQFVLPNDGQAGSIQGSNHAMSRLRGNRDAMLASDSQLHIEHDHLMNGGDHPQGTAVHSMRGSAEDRLKRLTA